MGDFDENTKKRFVGLFDVIGFGSLVEAADMTQLPKLVGHLAHISNIVRGYGGDPFDPDTCKQNASVPVKCILLSDTVFFFSEDDCDACLLSMIESAYDLIGQTFVSGFPLRGAIAYGDVYCNLELFHIYGKPVLEAYRWESLQQWGGAVLTPSCAEMAEQRGALGQLLRGGHLVQYPVPLKDGSKSKMYCINWPTWRGNDTYTRVIRDSFILWRGSQPLKEDDLIKIGNTLKFLHLGSGLSNEESEQRILKLMEEAKRMSSTIL